MHLLIAYSLLVKQELQNKRCFDILLTPMQHMEINSSNSNSRIIDLTADDKLVVEFVDLSKGLEVVDLCSCSCDSSISSSILV